MSILTLFWFAFDSRSLTADEAGHVLNSIIAGDLLVHFKPWQYQWWYQTLTISNFYPPVAYFFNGIFIKLFQSVQLGEHVAMAAYMFILTASAYAISLFLKHDRVTAAVGALCLAFYPIIAGLSHSAFLDLPAVAMAALAIAFILWWRNTSEPIIYRALIGALFTAAACLTKQTDAAFILPVGVGFTAFDCWRLFRRKPDAGENGALKWLGHDLLFAAVTALMSAPFFLINSANLRGYIARNVAALSSKGIHESFWSNLSSFCQLLPDAVSPLLGILFVASVIFAKRRDHVALLPVILSSVGGFFILCMAPGIVHDYRYVMPLFIAPALYSGFFLGNLFSSKQIYLKCISIAVMCCMLYAYINLTYSPTPLPLPALPWKARFPYYCKAVPAKDWGYDAVIAEIEKTGDKHVLLNVLVNTDDIHINGYRLRLAEKQNFDILPCGSRFYTITGDDVKFSPKQALSSNWYLWKTGPTGYCFNSKESARNFDQLVDFVVNSGHYRMKLQKPLPDGTELLLFRMKDFKLVD